MDDSFYDQVKDFLMHGIIPENIASTKSNFIATARKYRINARGFLTRQNKCVVRASEQELIFTTFHKHSGRQACWERIKQR